MCKNTKKEKIEKGELTDIVWEEKRTKQAPSRLRE